MSRWHANVEAFQLLEYQLPSSFAVAIENTEVARQEVEQMELQLSVASIDASTRLLSSQYQAERRLLTAQMTANATLLAGAVRLTLTLTPTPAPTPTLPLPLPPTPVPKPPDQFQP